MSKRKHGTISSIGVCTRSRRAKQNTDLPFLPIDIMFNILSRLPAEFLHNDVKYVSKTWANIVRDPLFIKMHLLHCSNDVGLLIQDSDKHLKSRYLEAKEGKIKAARPKYHLPRGTPLASCEGILLLMPHKDYLYVGNCVTKQWFMLPCHSFPTCKGEIIDPASYSGFSQIPQSGEFKVIFSCRDFKFLHHWHVLTVGTDDSWRKIEGGKFTEDEATTTSIWPISINGVIYWPGRCTRVSKFLAIDLSDESFHWIQVPKEFRSPFGLFIPTNEPSTYGLLKMGNHLSCILVSNSNHMEMNVWILEDMLSSRWVKIRTFECNVGLKVPVVWCNGSQPIAWLDSGRVLVFTKFQGIDKPCEYVVHDLTTGKSRYISNVHRLCEYRNVDHISTLSHCDRLCFQ